MNADTLLTLDDVAERLKVSPRTVSTWIKSGALPAMRFGRRMIRIEPSALQRFLEASRVDARETADAVAWDALPF